MNVSAVFRLGPWLRADGEPFTGDLGVFTEQITEYFAEQLTRFAEQRQVDVFLAVSVTRGEEQAGREFRNGHFVIAEQMEGL